MTVETIQNLGIFATGTAAAGLVVRYGLQRFSRLVERGIDRSAEVVERGIDRSTEVVERSIEECFDTKMAHHRETLEADRVASSRLHEERANAIVELYRRFVRFDRDVQALQTGITGDRDAEQLLQRATESGDAVSTYYADNKLYFPPDTCAVVESVLRGTNDRIDDVRAETARPGRNDQRTATGRGLVDGRARSGDEDLDLKRELETQCRALLGVDPDEDD